MSAGKVCALVSGGLDSGVLVADLLAQGREVHPLYVRAGFVWEDAELAWLKRYLRAVAHPRLKPLVVAEVPMDSVLDGHWGLTGRGVPPKGAANESVFLPGRNLVLLSQGAVLCAARKLPAVSFAILRGNPFPDATPDFLRAMERAVSQGLDAPIRVEAPYLGVSKDELIRRFARLPLHLTFSCMQPRRGRHCEACSKCEERERAMALAKRAREAGGKADALDLGALPDDPSVSAAIAHYNAGRFSAAARELAQAERRLPATPGLLFVRALVLGAAGRSVQAARSLEKAVRGSAPSPELSLAAAAKLREWGKPQAAVAHLRCAAKGKPGALLLAVEALLAAGKRGEAAKALRRALARAPQASGYLALAVLEAGEADAARALESCREAAKLRGADGGEWLPVVGALTAKGLRAAAWEAARLAARSCPREAAVLLVAAKAADEMGLPREAFRLCRAASEAGDSENGREALLLEAALRWRLGEREEALKAAAAASRDQGAPAKAAAYHAEMLELCGRFEPALEQWRRAAASDPKLEPAREALCRFALWQGRYAEAEARASDALRERPRSAPWLRARAAARMLGGKPRAALEDAQAALREDPKDGLALSLKGEALRRLGRLAPARKALTRALSRMPTLASAGVNRALTDIQSGREPDGGDLRLACAWRGDAKPGADDAAPALSRRDLEALLASWRGSREANPVFTQNGRLCRVTPSSGKEHLMPLQARIAVEEPRKVLALLAKAMRHQADKGQALAHRGELNLWLGRYAQARRDFARSLKVDARLRWPHVGLAAVETLAGRLDSAEKWLERGLANGAKPRVMRPWLAEILWRSGQRRQAFTEFQGCVDQHPTRLSSWVWLGIGAAAVGDRKELDRAWSHLLEAGYPLLYEAARTLGGLESGRPFDARRRLAVLRRCVTLMRGNRSSWLQTYARADGTLGALMFTTPFRASA